MCTKSYDSTYTIFQKLFWFTQTYHDVIRLAHGSWFLIYKFTPVAIIEMSTTLKIMPHDSVTPPYFYEVRGSSAIGLNFVF